MNSIKNRRVYYLSDMNWRLFIKEFWFFPVSNYTITTNNSISQVLEKVSQEMDFVDKFSRGGRSLSSKRFECYLTEEGFQIKRLLSFGHSGFIPLITGEVKVLNMEQSVVSVNVKFQPKVNYFLIFMGVFSLILSIVSMRLGGGLLIYLIVILIIIMNFGFQGITYRGYFLKNK